MSKFLKALEQAERDRALAGQKQAPTAPPGAAKRPASAVLPEAELRRPPVAPQSGFRRPLRPSEPLEIPEGVDDHLVSLVNPAGFEAEQYRALRYMIEQRHRADNLSIIAVSSAATGDGKTVTSLNLAGTLAQASEGRVLVVEADLRRPSVAALLGFGPGRHPGLVDAILDRNLTLAEIAVRRPPFNLSVVLAGQIPPSPYEVLKSPRLGELLEEARTAYDYVVIDTAPLVTVQDSRVIARWVDGIILVVGANQTPRRLVEEALNVVDPAKMLGFVFNGDDHGLVRLYSGQPIVRAPRGRRRRGWWARALRTVGVGRRAKPPSGSGRSTRADE
jgi:capsular exopolysaccharide synthesis family protein